MSKTEQEDLEKTYKKEKDPKVAARILAAHMVYVRKGGIDQTATDLMRFAKWVRS